MRPICFFVLIMGCGTPALVAQDPIFTSLRIPGWPETSVHIKGYGWSVFSRQYYSVSNWNVTGGLIRYSSGNGEESALICRDGIPGFSWYHLYLSHYQKIKQISGFLQLRFSLIDLIDRPGVFRIGGNMSIAWSLNPVLEMRIRLYDFPGWLFPGTPIARGDPGFECLLFHEPGRMIGLATGFAMGPSHFGPVRAGIRMNISNQFGLQGMIDVLPLGFSFGMTYQIGNCMTSGWIDHRSGPGLTPMIIVGSK
jgi:hypothetical protein